MGALSAQGRPEELRREPWRFESRCRIFREEAPGAVLSGNLSTGVGGGSGALGHWVRV